MMNITIARLNCVKADANHSAATGLLSTLLATSNQLGYKCSMRTAAQRPHRCTL